MQRQRQWQRQRQSKGKDKYKAKTKTELARCHQPTSSLSRWYRVIATANVTKTCHQPTSWLWYQVLASCPKAWRRSDIWGILAIQLGWDSSNATSNPAWMRNELEKELIDSRAKTMELRFCTLCLAQILNDNLAWYTLRRKLNSKSGINDLKREANARLFVPTFFPPLLSSSVKSSTPLQRHSFIDCNSTLKPQN